MELSSQFFTLCRKVLTESFSVETLKNLTKRVIPNYDFYEATQFPRSYSLSVGEVVRQFVKDVQDRDLFPLLISTLIEVDQKGINGFNVPIRSLRQLIGKLKDMGFLYDQDQGMFVEDPAIRKTSSWGVLANDREYNFSLLKIDIVQNTKLLREERVDAVRKAYHDLKNIVRLLVEKRNGRIWIWEGDGGLASFFLSKNKHLTAVLTGMEILHELFLYNLHGSPLEQNIRVRIAVHSGTIPFDSQCAHLHHQEVYQTLTKIEEKHTPPNSLSISPVVNVMIAEELGPFFTREPGQVYSTYTLHWEKL